MAEIGINELKKSLHRIVDEVESGQTYVVTKRGRPAVVLLPVDEAEDLVLAGAEELISMRRQARDDHRQGRTKSLADLG